MKLAALALAGAAAYFAIEHGEIAAQRAGSVEREVALNGAIERLHAERRSDVWVQSEGVVAKILRDDNDGSRHQRFIVELPSGHTVLIAHNIDLAPRVTPLAAGDRVQFYGEYAWNDKGGVVHWTHHDPQRRIPGGWVKREGELFQ